MGVLEGRVAIISGSSSGIGRACAIRYAEEGAAVVVCARRLDRLEALVSEISAKGGRALPVQCDVGSREDILAVVEAAAREFGRIDILANCAQGGMDKHGLFAATSPDELINAYNTGPIQTMIFMQACLPYMQAQNFGRIINFGSLVGNGATPGFTAAALAKASMVPLTRLAAKEWGQFNITTNALMPFMHNEASTLTPEGREAFARLGPINPMRRIGMPYEDCTPLMLFLATEGAGYVNGQIIGVDGGFG